MILGEMIFCCPNSADINGDCCQISEVDRGKRDLPYFDECTLKCHREPTSIHLMAAYIPQNNASLCSLLRVKFSLFFLGSVSICNVNLSGKER